MRTRARAAVTATIVAGTATAAVGIGSTSAAFTDGATASATVSAGQLAQASWMSCQNSTQSAHDAALVSWPAVPGATGYLVTFDGLLSGTDYYSTNQALIGIDQWALSYIVTSVTLHVTPILGGNSAATATWVGPTSSASVTLTGIDNLLLLRYVRCSPEVAPPARAPQTGRTSETPAPSAPSPSAPSPAGTPSTTPPRSESADDGEAPDVPVQTQEPSREAQGSGETP